MTAPPNGGPAFPKEDATSGYNGMTLRAYFAGQAMAAFVALPTLDQNAAETARCAVDHADALIAELAKARP